MKQHAIRQFVRQQTEERLKKLEAELKNSIDLPEDPDAIHDLHVAIRRLNQDLRVFQDWFPARRVKKLRGRLKKLMDRCGAVRNCDIAMAVLKTAGCQDEVVSQGLEKERTRAHKKLHQMLQKWGPGNRAKRWRENLEVAGGGEDAANTAAESACRILPAMIDELFRSGRQAAKAGSSHTRMHRFRLMTKRVRYTLEVFTPVYEEKMSKIMERLKGLQERLGAINDCAATLEMVGGNREASAVVRRLAGKRESEFRTYWKRHFGPASRGRWKTILGAPLGASLRTRTQTRTEKELDGSLHTSSR